MRTVLTMRTRSCLPRRTYTWEDYRNLPTFAKVTEFLAYANNKYIYDIKIKLCHLPRMPRFNPSDSSSRDASTEPETRQGTKTPASSLDFDMTLD
ncbi:hypothetical protein N7530_010678 [Penicillium desertorum]|uniref:Uncharacterized protein n=1 Tax=Penicillium desertorum TaxID=1303715 RepID=A0A9X0BHY7_9EURO|nr:hypothetical protein N7530_010678 [Penicillium desertorum]